MCFQTWFKNRRANDHKTGRPIPEHPTNRTDLTSQQRGILEDFYSHNRYPNDLEVQVLMQQKNLTYQYVQVCVIKINNFNLTD